MSVVVLRLLSSAAERTPTRPLAVGVVLHLRRRLSMLVDIE